MTVEDFDAALESIVYLWRQSDTMSLYGVPHELRPGQSPRDLFDAGNTRGWVWLGTPGWFGVMTRAQVEATKAYLKRNEDAVPGLRDFS